MLAFFSAYLHVGVRYGDGDAPPHTSNKNLKIVGNCAHTSNKKI